MFLLLQGLLASLYRWTEEQQAEGKIAFERKTGEIRGSKQEPQVLVMPVTPEVGATFLGDGRRERVIYDKHS